MQLDFLSKLTAWTRRHARGPAKSVAAPATHAERLDADTLQEQARTLLRALGCGEFAARVQVVWNPRMRSTAGTAHPGKSLIALNPRLRVFGDEEVDRTLRHELAHLLAHFRAGRRRIAPHGPEWRQACCDLGLADEQRCHTLPLPRRTQQKKHAYRCPGCGAVIHRVRTLRKKAACLACCRQHNRGRYDERFQFVKVPVR